MTWTLAPADYWELRARAADTQRVVLEARALVAAAQAREADVLRRLSVLHGFDPGDPLTADDASCTLTRA